MVRLCCKRLLMQGEWSINRESVTEERQTMEDRAGCRGRGQRDMCLRIRPSIGSISTHANGTNPTIESETYHGLLPWFSPLDSDWREA